MKRHHVCMTIVNVNNLKIVTSAVYMYMVTQCLYIHVCDYDNQYIISICGKIEDCASITLHVNHLHVHTFNCIPPCSSTLNQLSCRKDCDRFVKLENDTDF